MVQVVSEAHPDSYQFDPGSKYYDAKATTDKPRWWCVDVQLVKKSRYISISELRTYPELAAMQVLQKGNRLSITKVSPDEWELIQNLLNR